MATTEKTKASKVCIGTVLTEKEYITLNSMLGSKDDGNHLVARKILEGCDIEKSIYWIWKLADNHSWKMVYRRTKASREFDAECGGVSTLGYTDEEGFAELLYKKGWLTEEIFGYLKEAILLDISIRADNMFFDITAEIAGYMRVYDPKNKPKLIFKK